MSSASGQTWIIDPEAAYSRQEVAELLGINLCTLKKLIGAGQLRHYQPIDVPFTTQRILIAGDSVIATRNRMMVERLSKP